LTNLRCGEDEERRIVQTFLRQQDHAGEIRQRRVRDDGRLEKICSALKCDLSDIMEIELDLLPEQPEDETI
jgi:hypothetical protein